MHGTKNDNPPMAIASLGFSLSTRGSTSAPARKVRRTPANEARKSIHGVVVMCAKLPARTPKTISMIADEIASSTLNIEATRIRAKAKVANSRSFIQDLLAYSRRAWTAGPYHDY